MSGQIAFGPNGDPVDKAIVILYVDPVGRIHMEQTVEGRFLLK
jgi:eukaryotic-like serine/threonine-protein kinase